MRIFMHTYTAYFREDETLEFHFAVSFSFSLFAFSPFSCPSNIDYFNKKLGPQSCDNFLVNRKSEKAKGEKRKAKKREKKFKSHLLGNRL